MMTTDEVLIRLVEAHKVIESTVNSPRPKAYGSAMPEVINFPSAQAVYSMALDSLRNDNGQTWFMHSNGRIRELLRTARSHWTAKQITDAEEAILWPSHVEDPEMREILMLYVRCKARNGNWTRWLQNRNRGKSQREGVLKRKSYRCIEQSLQIITAKVGNRAIMLRERVA